MGHPLLETLFFYEISHVLGTFECLQTFLPILGLCIFTNSTLHWGLYVCTIPPCAEDFAFYDISYILEILSFYKLSLCTENFELLGFSPCIRDFVCFNEFSNILGTFEVLQTFPMYWRFCKCLRIPPCTGVFEFLRFPSCTEDFEFLRFSTCTGDLGFLWDLFFHVLGTYKPFFLYWNFVFLLISPCIEDFEFLRFSPCTEDFFYGISYVLETLRLYKLSSYTGDFGLLLISPCTGDYEFYLFPCIENFVFYEISHVMGTLNFYKLPPYTEDFEFPRKCRKSLKIEGFLQGTHLLKMSKIP